MENKKIWTPSDLGPKDSKQVKIKATIMDAKYHPLQKALIIAVRLPNGEARSMPDFARNHTFHGRAYHTVSAEEVDREMEKTAELYRRSKGRTINVQLDDAQASSAWDSI